MGSTVMKNAGKPKCAVFALDFLTISELKKAHSFPNGLWLCEKCKICKGCLYFLMREI